MSADTRDATCTRCNRDFRSTASRNHHTWFSKRHHICVFCGFKADFTSNNALIKHLQDAHYACKPCGTWYNTYDEFEAHDTKFHNRCGLCDRYFANENNLRMHRRIHDPRTVKCHSASCKKHFPSFSAMLIHLEAGNCPGGTDLVQVNMLAEICYQARKYFTSIKDACPFFCPRCHREYRLLSGLFQHVETTLACRELAGKGGCLGKLKKFIAKNV